MQKQHRQYVILVVVLLACAASVFFGIRSILHSNDEVTTFAVGDWEGITLPRYYGPTVYPTSQRLMATVTLPMTSTSSRSLFHHSVAPSYRAAVATTQQVHTCNATYRVHQTSDQHVRSLGSGAGAGGDATTGTTSYSSSSTSTYNIPHIALALPSVRTRTLANNNIYGDNLATSSVILADASTPTRTPRTKGLRRLTPDGEGEYPGEPNGDKTKIWNEIEGWVDPPSIGTICVINGVECVWTADGWRPTSDLPEPGTPIGDIPFILLLICAAAYSILRVRKTKTVTNL